jgi:uncharacterized protein
MLEQLLLIHAETTKNAPMAFKRYLYHEIDWSSRCICITGARGTGKTTILLQHLTEKYNNPEKCLYISADHIDVAGTGLYRIAEEYFAYGGEALIIDEVHKYPSWQIEIKNIIDTFRTKKVIISGSSSLDLKRGKADLSRRFAYYDLKGLSFREYLKLKEKIEYNPFTLDQILLHHTKLAKDLASAQPVLKLFDQYLNNGYYPFVLEGEAVYLQKVMNVIEKVFYEDIAVIGNLKKNSISVLKKLLWTVASSVPFTVNIDRLSRELGTAKEYIYLYIDYLEDAGLLNPVHTEGKGLKLARKPAKLFLENTNLLAAVGGSLKTISDIGTIRETFFVNQLKQGHKIRYSNKGDFIIDDRFIFEIGGKSKDFHQLKGEKNGYVAAANIEIGFGRKIPLYLLGFLY